MPVKTDTIALSTKGDGEMRDITPHIARCITDANLNSGTVTVFVPGSTGGLTTIEFEPGLVQDMADLFDRIAPQSRTYAHNERWGDGNGHSHVRASLLGPSLTVPFVNGRLTLGTWQQIVFIDFDNRPRKRELVVQILGE